MSVQSIARWMVWGLLCVPTLLYGATRPDSVICDAAAHHAAQSSDVPLGILLSITRVETGRTIAGDFMPWPWAANVSGKGYFFASRSEAVAFARQQLAAGNANFDVGCFQINLRWHSKNFSSVEQAFDPHENAAYAAQFLTQLHQSEGSWSAAVAAYHSRTPDLADIYLQKVKSVWQKISDAPPIDPSKVTMMRENRYPLLQHGQTGQAGSLVPRLGAVPFLIGQN